MKSKQKGKKLKPYKLSSICLETFTRMNKKSKMGTLKQNEGPFPSFPSEKQVFLSFLGHGAAQLLIRFQNVPAGMRIAAMSLHLMITFHRCILGIVLLINIDTFL